MKQTKTKTKTTLPPMALAEPAVELVQEPSPAAPAPPKLTARAKIPLRCVNLKSRASDKHALRLPILLLTLPFIRELSSNAKLIYAVLLHCVRPSPDNDAAHVDPNGDIYCYFRDSDMAALLNVSKRTVVRATNELRRLRLLRTVRGKNGIKKVYVYSIGAPETCVSSARLSPDKCQNVTTDASQTQEKPVKLPSTNSASRNADDEFERLWFGDRE